MRSMRLLRQATSVAALLLLCAPGVHASGLLVTVGSLDQVDIRPEVLVDESGAMTLAQARASSGFQTRSAPLVGPETGKAVRWLRWTMQSDAEIATKWYVALDFQESTLFVVRGSGAASSSRTGSDVPLGERAVPRPHPLVVPVILAPKERVDIFVRTVHDAEAYGLYGTVGATEAQRFSDSASSNEIVQGLMLGSLLALAAYNFLLFLSFLDRSYIYYAAFLLGTVVYWGAKGGHLFSVAWPDSLGTYPQLSYYGLVVGAIGYVLFARSFLNSKSTTPTFDRALRILVAGWALCAILGFAGYWTIAMVGAGLLGAATPLATLAAGVLALRAGFVTAKFYVLAALALVASGVTYAVVWLLAGHGPPSLWVTFQFSLVTEAILLSLALAHRIRVLHADRLAAQEALKVVETHTEELQASHEMRTHVLGLAAHDLRSPLTGIMGFADLIEADSDENSEHFEYAGIIKKDADRMLALINDLLVSAAIDGKSIELQRVPMDLREVVSESVGSFQLQAEKKGQTLRLDLPDTIVPVNGDSIRLRQVFDNLVSNAVKYSPHAGAISVAITIRDGEAIASIRDSGPGLSADDKSHLFERFTRLTAQPTGGENSTGLGLSIVHELAEMHGGRVDVQSELGHGATFLLVLPVHHGVVESAQPFAERRIPELT